MTDKQKDSMQNALAALESGDLLCELTASRILREALSEPEPVDVGMEPVAWRVLESGHRYALYFNKYSADRSGEVQTPRTFPEALYTANQFAAAVLQERDKWQADAERYRFAMQSEDYGVCVWDKAEHDWFLVDEKQLEAARTGEQK